MARRQLVNIKWTCTSLYCHSAIAALCFNFINIAALIVNTCD